MSVDGDNRKQLKVIFDKENTQTIICGRLGRSASKTQQSRMLAMLGLVPRRQPTVVHSFLEIS